MNPYAAWNTQTRCVRKTNCQILRQYDFSLLWSEVLNLLLKKCGKISRKLQISAACISFRWLLLTLGRVVCFKTLSGAWLFALTAMEITSKENCDQSFNVRCMNRIWRIVSKFGSSFSGRISLKGGFRFCTQLGEYTTIVDSNILNTVTLAILVASFKLTHNKHSKFDFFAISRS